MGELDSGVVFEEIDEVGAVEVHFEWDDAAAHVGEGVVID